MSPSKTGTADWEITYSYYPATSNIYQKTIEDYTTKQRIQYTYNNEGNIIVYEVVGTDENLDWINTTKKYDHNGNLIEEGLFGPGVPGLVGTIYIIGSVL